MQGFCWWVSRPGRTQEGDAKKLSSQNPDLDAWNILSPPPQPLWWGWGTAEKLQAS